MSVTSEFVFGAQGQGVMGQKIHCQARLLGVVGVVYYSQLLAEKLTLQL